MQRTSWLKCLLVVAGGGCVEPVVGPPPPVEAPPDFVSAVVERGIFVDVNSTYLGLTLLTDQGQPSLFYLNGELNEIRYAGCPARCEDERFWLRGTVDTSRFALDDNAGGAAGMDAAGTIHILYGRRYYANCYAHCDVATSWTRARIDSSFTSSLSLAVAPDGQLHAMSIVPGLVYATCAAQCTDGANWQKVQIAPAATPAFRATGTAITRDATGRLHVAFMT